MIAVLAAYWLRSAGVEIPRKAGGSVDFLLEVALSLAREKEDIKEMLNRIPVIKLSG